MTETTFVEVTGHGSAMTTPDLLRAYLGTSATATTVGQAFELAESALGAITTTLREHGVRDQDLRTTGMELYNRQERVDERVGFYSTMALQVVLRDLDTAGEILSAAVEAGGGASRIHGVHLASSDHERVMVSAREAAFADARGKAEQYAALSGRALGAVLSMRELDGRAVPGMDDHAAKLAAAGRGGVSVERGEQAVHAFVTVSWELA